ncbi:MAG TPA: VOC family protein [Vicinamibacterales bacterium]|nr:VOC family protein [Vicinamibacterales bacterium]
MDKVAPCLWFDGVAEEAARFYTSLLPNSSIDRIVRRPADSPVGATVLVVDFTLGGRTFTALNGGPRFKFNEAVSFQIPCEDQAEADRLADALSANPEADQCGWVKDRYGVSWQIIPKRAMELLTDPDAARATRAMEAMLPMKRLDVAALERAVNETTGARA